MTVMKYRTCMEKHVEVDNGMKLFLVGERNRRKLWSSGRYEYQTSGTEKHVEVDNAMKIFLVWKET